MECECNGGKRRVLSHDVVRHFTVVGNYNMCGKCQRVEWNWLTGDLEIEIKDTLHHWFVKPLKMSAESRFI